jgi:hypothetical protein
LLFNNRYAEIKSIIGTKTSIQNAIKDGKNQANFILIHIPNGLDEQLVNRTIKGQFKHHNENLDVWVFDKSKLLKFNLKQKE